MKKIAVAHTQRREQLRSRYSPFVVSVYRHRRATLTTALKSADAIRRAGYLVWVEATDRPATR